MKLNLLKKLKELLENSVVYTERLQAAASNANYRYYQFTRGGLGAPVPAVFSLTAPYFIAQSCQHLSGNAGGIDLTNTNSAAVTKQYRQQYYSGNVYFIRLF
jgi:hypothetical protein